MRKVIDYEIAQYMTMLDDVHHISGKVNEMISEGWEPVGGICIKGNRVYQAMVKYEEVKSSSPKVKT